MKLELSKIRTDGATQPRTELSHETIESFMEDMRAGAIFPPVIVFYDGKAYWLADGFHRVEAALRIDTAGTIEAEVTQGTRSDAQWHSYSVNQAHGLRRSREDVERAVRAALTHPNGAKLSDGQIAEHVGVHQTTISRHRARLEPSTHALHESPARTGRDGRTIDTSNIGKREAKPSTNGNGKRKNGKVSLPDPAVKERNDRAQAYRRHAIPVAVAELPNNNAKNCAYALLEHFSPEYLEAVHAEIVRITEERSQLIGETR